jgi:serine/threonine protein kinase
VQPLISLWTPTLEDKNNEPSMEYKLGPELSISIDECVQICEELSRGGFATVHRAIIRLDGEQKIVAVKQLIKQRARNERDRRRIVNEMGIMYTMNQNNLHDYVVPLVAYDLNTYSICMEYMAGGDLYKFLHNRVHERLHFDHVIDWAIQLANCLYHFHKCGFVHTDLKSLNVLISANGKLKISDLTDVMAVGSKKFEPHGTPFWIAPEVLRHESCTTKSDIYSLGIILWELFTGCKPYAHCNALEVLESVTARLDKPFRMDIPETHNKHETAYTDIIDRCWSEDPNIRPTAEQIRDELIEISRNIM